VTEETKRKGDGKEKKRKKRKRSKQNNEVIVIILVTLHPSLVTHHCRNSEEKENAETPLHHVGEHGNNFVRISFGPASKGCSD